MPHDDDFDHEHYANIDWTEQARSMGDLIEMVTVGIDVGSSTSHLMFSRLHLQRMGAQLLSRYVVILRETLHRSPILLTPYTPDYNIDAAKLGDFVHQAYRTASLKPGDVDSGAIILTGEAVKRHNARALSETLAGESGHFVCATAGANLEAVLAAHGSGAVSLSRLRHDTVLNIDVGGGTTKLALMHDGAIVETAAVNVGGRLVALDESGRIVRIEPAAREIAEALGLRLELGAQAEPDLMERLASLLADTLVEVIALSADHEHDHHHDHEHGHAEHNGRDHGGDHHHEPGQPHGLSALAQELMITPPLHSHRKIGAVTFSGGVSEYIYEREKRTFGDIGIPLAAAIRRHVDAGDLPAQIESAGERIRATVIGASQFTVQVSGNTIAISEPDRLPMRNLQVVQPRLPNREAIQPLEMAQAIRRAHQRLDLTLGEQEVAVAVNWNGTPSHALLYNLAAGIIKGLEANLAAGHPLVLIFSNDCGSTIGHILRDELKVTNDLISIDGIELSEFDFIDIGEIIQPAQAVPVVVKSLVFPAVDPQPGEVLAG